jgi:hypothetical protein
VRASKTRTILQTQKKLFPNFSLEDSLLFIATFMGLVGVFFGDGKKLTLSASFSFFTTTNENAPLETNKIKANNKPKQQQQ